MHTIDTNYTIMMALQDYMPVLLSSIGLFLLARMTTRMDREAGRLAYFGWLLISLGGFNKATWKLIMAGTASQTNLVWLDDSLFMLMGPGFVCMAWALWCGQRTLAGRKRPIGPIWAFPLVVGGLHVAVAVFLGTTRPDTRTWFFVMLGLTTIGNFVVGGLAIRQARQRGMHFVGFLFAFNLVAILVLTGLARIDPRTDVLEWTAQITNTISNGAFAYAAWKLCQEIEARVPAVRVAAQTA
ncbi:MAG: hypothetical protein HXY40_15310 [Chloroflexi bacterium]|nr:hypothetical protein [Chloroflexota bacterium]